MIDLNHFVASVHYVNPLDINKSERMGAMERIAQAIPIHPDLL